ncbi:MAG: roadblock/LC7 domain-containing protein [Hassallia sp.]
MPLGKILKLLAEAFPKTPTESVNASKLPTTENTTSPTTAENTETLPIVTEDNPLPISTENIEIDLPIILEEKVMINTSMLQDELQNFVSGTSEVQGAALVSPDGLSLASVLPGGMDDERTAAMSASMLSLGERIGSELARGNVERIVVEGEKGYGVLVGCGSDAVLLVLANASVKQGLLFLEIKRAVARIAPLLG